MKRSHIRRLDVLAKGAALAALCLHWFNPLVWCMVFLLDRDLEQACDERAIALLGERWKDRYALALVALGRAKTGLCTVVQRIWAKRIGRKGACGL